MAVAVSGGRALDEAGEDGMDDGVYIAVAFRVRARLEAGVADVGLADEAELLGKIVASLVGGVRDGDREDNVCETVLGGVGYVP